MNSNSTHIITSNDCSICYNKLMNDTITLPCNHIFHNDCMNMWKKYNNICPYCRYNLNQDRSPTTLYDEMIAPDGNIDGLNEDNYHYFYYYDRPIFTRTQILEYINKIKIAQQLKKSLLICEDYYINRIDGPNFPFDPTFGKLIKIGGIKSYGVFSCSFQTDKGIRIFNTNLHQFTRITIIIE